MSLRVFREDGKGSELDSEELDGAKLGALENETRRDILDILAEEPGYPAGIAKELGVSKQKAYYHFEKLQEAGIIEKVGEKELSGGKAKIYSVKSDALHYDLKGRGKSRFLPDDDHATRRFLSPLVEEGVIQGEIVVGSPEPHGEDRVRAFDGHLAGDLAAKLGNHGKFNDDIVVLDTQLKNREDYRGSFLLLGGILTNTASRRFNGAFPVEFTGEDFPYREAETEGSNFSDPDIGFIAKAENPEDQGSFIFLVAGIGRRGTRGAVKAFQDLEDLVGGYGSGSFLKTVRALDSKGDGMIDSYEVVD